MFFEHKTEQIVSPKHFLRRLLRYGLIAALLIGLSLGLGVLGYRYLCHLGWVDSIYNASMILAGMGPVDILQTSEAKLFASAYAIFSGVAFLTAVSVFFAPIVHRFFHVLHADDLED